MSGDETGSAITTPSPATSEFYGGSEGHRANGARTGRASFFSPSSSFTSDSTPLSPPAGIPSYARQPSRSWLLAVSSDGEQSEFGSFSDSGSGVPVPPIAEESEEGSPTRAFDGDAGQVHRGASTFGQFMAEPRRRSTPTGIDASGASLPGNVGEQRPSETRWTPTKAARVHSRRWPVNESRDNEERALASWDTWQQRLDTGGLPSVEEGEEVSPQRPVGGNTGDVQRGHKPVEKAQAQPQGTPAPTPATTASDIDSAASGLSADVSRPVNRKEAVKTAAKTILGAVHSGDPEAVVAALKITDDPQAIRELTSSALVLEAAKSGNGELFEVVLDALQDRITLQEVARLLSSAFHLAATEVRGSGSDGGHLVALSIMLQHGTQPSREDLILLARTVDDERLSDCFFRAVASARNSFIPGLNLSFALDAAADESREVERKLLIHLRCEIDDVLTEVLRWLPNTVSGVSGGMAVCAALLEPELTNTRVADNGGPLFISLRCAHRVVTFATTPLGLDYMFQKFTRGLPGLGDGARVSVLESPQLDLREEAKAQESLTALCRGSWLGGVLNRASKAISGDQLCHITFMPGVHFIATGIAALPNSYYRVPAVRMLWDLIVYIGVLVLFTKYVLFIDDDGPVEAGEIAFATFVVAALMAEFAELRRDVEEYLVDRWNMLDVVALMICLVGFMMRVADNENAWGRGLYSAGAPLMFWRLLFFAQILPFQGVMIQVIFAMVTELVQFGVVMGVVMLGFAVAFFALFRDVDDMSLFDTLLKVFKAMLGEVGFFDDFEGTRYSTVATLLLVAYLIVMTIMLLNLLIAVLSTAHASTEQSVLIRVSTARLYMYYRWTVANDTLPPPINLLQTAVSLPCRALDFFFETDIRPVARRAVGRGAFWLIMGPVAILAGSLLWLFSIPKGVALILGAPSAGRCSIVSRMGRTLLCFLWCTVGVPLSLTLAWLGQWLRVCSGSMQGLEAARPPQPPNASVESLLKDATGGLGMAELRTHLKNPVMSCSTWHANIRGQDRTSTLEHVKLLQEHLKATTKERIDELQVSLEARMAAITEQKVGRLEGKLDRLLKMSKR